MEPSLPSVAPGKILPRGIGPTLFGNAWITVAQTNLNLLRDAGPLLEKWSGAAEQELMEPKLSVPSAYNAAAIGSEFRDVWATSSSINALKRFWTLFTAGHLKKLPLPTWADTVCQFLQASRIANALVP